MSTVPWITITAENLRAYLVAEQVAALQAEALAPGQADPFVEIMPDVVSKMRTYIASNLDNQLDAEELALPPSLKLDAIYIIMAAMLGRLQIAMTKDQADAHQAARSTLIALREKKLLVEKPTNPITPAVQGGTGAVLVSAAPRQATAQSLRNL